MYSVTEEESTRKATKKSTTFTRCGGEKEQNPANKRVKKTAQVNLRSSENRREN